MQCTIGCTWGESIYTGVLMVHYWCTYDGTGVLMYWCSMGGVHMSGVTASRGEMMQVTPDVARDQREAVFLFLCLLQKKKTKKNHLRRNFVVIEIVEPLHISVELFCGLK